MILQKKGGKNQTLWQEISDLLIHAPRKFELFCSPGHNVPKFVSTKSWSKYQNIFLGWWPLVPVKKCGQ